MSVNYLHSLPASALFHGQHKLRHPLALYNSSLGAVSGAFGQVLKYHWLEFEHFHRTVEATEDYFVQNAEHLLKAQRELLYALMEHIDDCYSVMKSFVDPSGVSAKAAKQKFNEQYLELAGFDGVAQFKSHIAAYRTEYLAPLVNGLKHRGCRLRLVHFYNTQELRLGYYLEDAHADGIIGPAESLHDGGDTAFSFYRDLLFHFYHVHLISSALTGVLKAFLKDHHNITLEFEKREGYEEWTSLTKDLSKLYRSYFPDEVGSCYGTFFPKELKAVNPSLDTHFEEGELVAMRISYPGENGWLMWPFIMRWGNHWLGDGMTTSYRVPYLRGT